MDQHITPKLLREYAQRIAIQPPGAQDPQDWDEMTTMFARAFNAAAAEIERLNSEVAVRDRALATACLDITGYHEEANVAVSGYMASVRAELAREQEAANADH